MLPIVRAHERLEHDIQWGVFCPLWNCVDAVLRKARHSSSGILNQRDSSYHFGTIELKVRLEDVDRASQLIEDTDA